MNEFIEFTIWQRPENEEKINTYVEAMRTKNTVIIENFICLVSNYECDNSYRGVTMWKFVFYIVDYVKGKK